jgi:hypothetical protein
MLIQPMNEKGKLLILSEIPIQIPASYYIDIETKLPQLLLK